MATAIFLAKVVLQLLVPAVIYGVSVYLQGDLRPEYLGKWFAGNYLYMAAPHLLMAVLAAGVPLRKRTLLQVLVGLNLVLVSFRLFIHWFVYPPESGLVWVFYYPLCALFFAAFGAASYAMARRKE